MPATTTISVVICAYANQRWDDLVSAVASVEEQQVDAAVEIVVVIDHNVQLAARTLTAFTGAVVVENQHDSGLSGARNTGINAATGEIVVFLDDDAIAEPGWLRALVAAYGDPGVVGVGGAVLPLWAVGRPRWFPREFDWVVGCTYRGLPENLSPVRNPIGANMSFRSQVFRDVGLFRSGVGRVGANAVGCEETELCIRTRQHWPERRIMYEPAAAVLHRVPAQRGTWQYFLKRCYAEGQSKAVVSRLVGSADGLSSERTYTSRVLPLGVARGIRAAVAGDMAGAGRAIAIVGGLAATTLGYVQGRTQGNALPSPLENTPGQGFGPIQVAEVELSLPLPSISSHPGPGDRHYARSLLLVRLHGRAIGTVPLALTGGVVPAEQVAAEIQAHLGEQIANHLRCDGTALTPVLGAEGIIIPRDPACTRESETAVQDAPFASVVVPTRDRTSELVNCLQTLMAMQYPHFEIIVVDNGPTTGATRELVEHVSAHDERVRYVCEAQPGLSRAKNRGLAEARGEIVAFTDDDVLVDTLWLAELARAFQVSPRVACVTGLIFPRELETAAQSWIEQFGGFGKGFSRQVFDMDQNRPAGVLYPYTAGMFGSGANMAFKTDKLRELGGFDVALGAGSAAMGGEDLAVTYGAIVSGYQIVYEPSAIVHHLHHRDYERLRRQVYGYGVGLTAYVAQTVAQKPRSLIGLCGKLPLGIAYALNPWSGKNRDKADYPRELTFIELRGMLYGPLAYWRSRRSLKKISV